LLVLATGVFVIGATGAALGKGYVPGFYAGHTTQGKPLSFLAVGGKVSDLYTQIVDRCDPGSYTDTLFPHPVRITARGSWSHRAAEIRAQPTVYHGHLGGSTASGTIDDIADSGRKRCHGHVGFHAARRDPVGIGPATVGGRGTDVELRLTMPPASNGNVLVPYTPTALLVYGSNTGCPASYQAADALARSIDAAGNTGLISDAYVDADYEMQPYEGAFVAYRHGVFTFHAATNTVLPTATGQSPFSTVCVMLYSGIPATLTPARNVALDTIHRPLIPGPGIPDNQP
jgi:hypothetical protein